MNRHADFDVVQVEDDRVFVVDMDCGGPSVTNDAEYVRDCITRMYPNRRLIYSVLVGFTDEQAVALLCSMANRFQSNKGS